METPSPQTPNLDFEIGAEVHCREESCGKLKRVVIDPDTERVVALVIERGFLQKDARVVPLRVVAEASPDTIQLDLNTAEVENYPEYNETEYAVPADDWSHERYNVGDATFWAPPYLPVINEPVMPMLRQTVREGISSTQEVVGTGTPVRDRDGEIGVVDRVLTNRQSGAITHLVVKPEGLLDNDARIVPIAFVSEIDDLGVIVNLEDRPFEDLPEYRPRRRKS
jgi:uncharacterized protein YrrD